MKLLPLISISFLFLFSQCGLVDPGTQSGQFVLDTLRTTLNPTNLEFAFTAHFVARPGSLFSYSFSVGNRGVAVMLEPINPTPMDQLISTRDTLRLDPALGVGSWMWVRYEFSGVIYEPSGNRTSFKLKDSLYSQVATGKGRANG